MGGKKKKGKRENKIKRNVKIEDNNMVVRESIILYRYVIHRVRDKRRKESKVLVL